MVLAEKPDITAWPKRDRTYSVKASLLPNHSWRVRASSLGGHLQKHKFLEDNGRNEDELRGTKSIQKPSKANVLMNIMNSWGEKP